jgi:hypothetical protein
MRPKPGWRAGPSQALYGRITALPAKRFLRPYPLTPSLRSGSLTF